MAFEEAIVAALLSEAKRVKDQVPESFWFLFGSFTKTDRPAADIDLLVICETTGACAEVRTELAEICGQFPIHLMLVTRSENVHLDFVQTSNAIELIESEIALPG